MPTIYFDACCLNRPFDDQSQDRIRLEAEAVLLILSHIQAGEWQWIGSDVLNLEMSRFQIWRNEPELRFWHQMSSAQLLTSQALKNADESYASWDLVPLTRNI
jgi:hypothetical protein